MTTRTASWQSLGWMVVLLLVQLAIAILWVYQGTTLHILILQVALVLAGICLVGWEVIFLPLRLVITTCLATVWVLAAAIFLAYLLPPNLSIMAEPMESSRYEDFAGVQLEQFDLKQMVGLITVAFFAVQLIYLAFPLDESGFVTWFSWAAFGWMACIFAALLMLAKAGTVVLPTFAVPFDQRTTAGIWAGLFLLPMVVVLFGKAPVLVRLVCMAALLYGFLRVESELFDTSSNPQVAAVVAKWGGNYGSQASRVAVGNGVNTGLEWYLITIVGATATVALATIGFSADHHRGLQLGGLIVLLVAFSLTLCLGWFLMSGRISGTTGDGEEMWIALVVACALSPFFGWLGMPWAAGHRIKWLVTFAIVGFAVAYVVRYQAFDHYGALLTYIHRSYNGPHAMLSHYFIP